MASFDVCYDFMMDNEDPKREYAIVPDAGGMAISGINSKAWPLAFEQIAKLDVAERGLEVETFYQGEFWNQWLAQLNSQELANRVFDASVNMGEVPTVKLLQGAVNAVSPPLKIDGQWGPHTVSAVNSVAGDELVDAFKTIRCAHYRTIATNNPSEAQYLPQWLARAMK